MILLIQGMYFQHCEGVGLGVRPGAGVVAVVHQFHGGFSFDGRIFQDPTNALGGLIGVMNDEVGSSKLTDIRLSENTLSFIKTYDEGRERSIAYTFEKRKGNEWVGHYTLYAGEKGGARCVLTEVGDDFLTPPPIGS